MISTADFGRPRTSMTVITAFGMIGSVKYVVREYPVPNRDTDADRYNPKMWARWFREFLEDLYGAFSRARIQGQIRKKSDTVCGKSDLVTLCPRARASPLAREWKMKSWKQAHGGL